MGLDLRYMPISFLQERIVDKDDGFALAGGKVYFYKDNSRTELKPIYEISGTPPNYVYTALPNPIVLSSIGTFQDDEGNDVIGYYYPYDENGLVELYYVVVESSTDVPQFTREGQPNVGEDVEIEGIILKNYVPNGQFLVHNDIPATPIRQEGEIIDPVTWVAYGGWYFSKPDTDTISKDFVYFPLITSWTSNPSASPRYACRVVNTVPNAAAGWKDLIVRFRDVNKFASGSKYYTLIFTGKSNTSTPVAINLQYQKQYGDLYGGSPTETFPFGSALLESGNQTFKFSKIFESNEGKTIINGHDYFELIFSFPRDTTFDLQFVDIVLAPDKVSLTTYPVTTEAEDLYRSVAGFMPVPNPDGSDLYLPLKLTQQGMIFDHDVIGTIVMWSRPDNPVNGNLLHCDGSAYRVNNYSDVGIPYSRLFNYLYSGVERIPRYGTGIDNISAYFSGTGSNLVLSTNKFGSVTNTVDGAVPTGFTFETVHTGTSGYEVKCYTRINNTFYLIPDNLQTTQAANYYSSYSEYDGLPIMPTSSIKRLEQEGTYATKLIEYNQLSDGSTIIAGDYGVFVIIPLSVITSTNTYGYFWYKVDGSGSDPTPTRTGNYKYSVQININSTDDSLTVAEETRMALNGWHVSKIKTLAASSITAGSYFTFSSQSEDFYVWYKKDGSGNDPDISGKIGIEVDISSSDTNTQVAEKTQIAANSVYFAVPDYRGRFLRAQDEGALIDPEVNTRYSMVPGVSGALTGTDQFDRNRSHSHNTPADNGGSTLYTFATNTNGDPRSRPAFPMNDYPIGVAEDFTNKGKESRPINSYVKLFIKY